jgi:peptidoglycan/xylan/chitin deacetylase (PgdA/CDA1 family)
MSKKAWNVMGIMMALCVVGITGCVPSPDDSSEDPPPPWEAEARADILKMIDDTWEELGYSEKPTKYIALSFDDGPSTQSQALMDALEAQKVHATFFLIGNHVTDLPETVRAIRDAGYEIGNHSQSGAGINAETVGPAKRIIQSCNDAIFDATNVDGKPVIPKYFRAPGFTTSKNTLTACGEMNLPIVHGIICNEAEKVLDAAKEWGMIVNHDPFSDAGAVAALPVYVAWLREQGYYILTVRQLLILRNAGELTPGKIYHDFVTVP